MLMYNTFNIKNNLLKPLGSVHSQHMNINTCITLVIVLDLSDMGEQLNCYLRRR